MATIYATINDLKVETALHAFTCDLCGASITLGEKHLVRSSGSTSAKNRMCHSCAADYVAQVNAQLQEIERELAARSSPEHAAPTIRQ